MFKIADRIGEAIAAVLIFLVVVIFAFYPLQIEGIIENAQFKGNTYLKFKDGRNFNWHNLPEIDILPNNKYRITYNRCGFIYKVEALNQTE